MGREADEEVLARLEQFRRRSIVDVEDATTVTALSSFVADHGVDPIDYVVGLMSRHDVVMLGERHPSTQSGELLADLVPALAAAGVWNLGAEWLLSEDQAQLDAIVSADEFDEVAAQRCVLRWAMRSGVVPALRVEVLRSAWEVNARRDPNAPFFRVMGLDYDLDYDAVTDRADLHTPEAWPHLRDRGPAARHMATIIEHEFMRPRRRAVVSCSTDHAISHHRRPSHPVLDRYDVDCEDDLVYGAGAHVFGLRADRIATVLVHQALPGRIGGPAEVYPADGLIDMMFARADAPKWPVGFDVTRSPFAPLTTSSAHDPTTLGRLADGWIFLDPFHQLEAPEPLVDALSDEDVDWLRRRMLAGAHRRPDNDLETLVDVVNTETAGLETWFKTVGIAGY